MEKAGASVEPRCLSLWLSFLNLFPLLNLLHLFQETVSTLRMLNMLNTHIHFLGKNLALNVFVYSMLSDIVDTFSFAMVIFMGQSFLNSIHFPDVYNITFLVDSYTCGQRNNSMFSKWPRECI